ncbi:hypothetical protein PR202_ga29845 [Eleusine coracana subsp. coracana]|uniref:Legume lectin domain-containing protein n=1 Tax=Eleusine coracana subsp. coracana TaxID=191504 RepID=A0AAV5DM79_ELECO|nr:hypothetical protein PR202_ga29845 [Eleusine coracana subsp. coracana]
MSDNHVGIDVNGLESMDADNAGYYDDTTGSSFRNLSLISRKAMQVWVDFDGQTMQQVNVTMAPLQLLRPKKPLLSTIIVNLSSVIDDTAPRIDSAEVKEEWVYKGVLLESSKTTEVAVKKDVLLLDWVRDHQRQGTALDTMDSRLGGIYDADEARLALNLGLMCAHPGADTRPGMRKVVQLLTAGRRPPYTGGDDAGAE